MIHSLRKYVKELKKAALVQEVTQDTEFKGHVIEKALTLKLEEVFR